MASTLFIVPTPIGNIEDITLRALATLKSVSCIACEDTRVSQKLLSKYSIGVRLLDCHKFNEKQRSSEIIKLLENGEDVALISDAGTPLISDPGSVLLREIHERGFKTVSLPGACAVTTFLSSIERETEEFAFVGFLPRTEPKQAELFEKFKNINTVFYEAPTRLMKTLENIKNTLGDDCRVAIGRELTKVYEEIKSGSVNEIIDYYSSNTLKGEIVGLIFAQKSVDINDEEVINNIKKLHSEGYSAKDCVKILTLLFDLPKNKIYELTQKIYNGR